MAEIKHRNVETNGIKMHIAEAGEGPLVLMLHGFPELWYSWRHQLPALAEAGYHAVAADVRGYGESDRPHEIEAYSMKNHVADALGILDALGEETAVIVGHDWGAPMAWNSAVLHPERYRAVVALSVPFLPRSPMPPTQMFKAIFQDKFFYMLYFQEPGVAEEEFESDVRRSMLMFMYGASAEGRADPNVSGAFMNKPADAKLFDGLVAPEKLPDWLTKEDLDYYTEAFKKTGFRGPLNRYRNMDRDWEELPELGGSTVQQPALYITGDKDPVGTFAPMDPMKASVPNLKIVTIPDAGHWTQQEAPERVNEELVGFLRGLSA
jgi:pimeloyl-ACP methyl ester carboxylesterase